MTTSERLPLWPAVRAIAACRNKCTTVGNGFGLGHIKVFAIDSTGSVVVFNPITHVMTRVDGAGLGPGFSAAGFEPLWTPTRKCHRATPEWTRDAVRTVVLLAKRATRLGGDSGWLERAPMLPPTVWDMIIGLLPMHQIGRAAGGRAC